MSSVAPVPAPIGRKVSTVDVAVPAAVKLFEHKLDSVDEDIAYIDLVIVAFLRVGAGAPAFARYRRWVTVKQVAGVATIVATTTPAADFVDAALAAAAVTIAVVGDTLVVSVTGIALSTVDFTGSFSELTE